LQVGAQVKIMKRSPLAELRIEFNTGRQLARLKADLSAVLVVKREKYQAR
jgi:hypothetical protein